MGNAVSFNGHEITPTTLSDHINVRRYSDISGWRYSERDATVVGNIERTTGTVYVNGNLVCTKGDRTRETDEYNTGSWDYRSGAHTDTTSGYISGGSSTVYVNGSPIAREGDSVETHGDESTTIAEGSSNVFAG